MKSAIEIALIIFALLLCQSCHEKKHLLTKEGEIISKLQDDKTQSEKFRKSAGVLLDVLEEKENIKIRDYLNAKREISSVRSLATAQAWIALLEFNEKKLPDSLPSAEEMDMEEKKNNENQTTDIYYSTTIRLSLINSSISALSYLDMPEAKSAMESFLQRFEKKYGDSSGGRKMLKKYRLERSQHEEDTRRGLAPWQTGLKVGDGVS